MSRAIHQLLTVFDKADAQGGMALFLRDTFRRWGCESKIYAGTIVPPSDPGVLPASSLRLPGEPEEILIHHYSIHSPVGELFLRSRRRQVIVYHNITPGEFFRGWDDFTFLLCRRARRDLSRFIPTNDLALAVSRFSASELSARGFPRVEVLPFPTSLDHLSGPVDERLLETYGKNDRINLLFVGRITPNKKQEDILKVFHSFQKHFRPDSRLFLVGAAHVPSYAGALERLARDLGLNQVRLTGKTSGEELRAYYRIADLFLCLSEHEGFCVPLIESFQRGIPVIAYAAGAVPETMGGAGLLITEKEPLKIAALIDTVLGDERLKKAIVEGQNRRLQELRAFPYEQRLREHLSPWL